MFSWEYLRVAQMYSKTLGTGEGKAIQQRFVLVRGLCPSTHGVSSGWKRCGAVLTVGLYMQKHSSLRCRPEGHF